MEKHYTHLPPEKRDLIMAGHHKGTSGANIAWMLSRSPTSFKNSRLER